MGQHLRNLGSRAPLGLWVHFPPLLPHPKPCAVPPEAYPLLPVSPFSIFCLSTDPDTSVCPSQWVPPGPGRQQGCWDRAAASMKKAPGGAPSSRLGLCLMPVLCLP